MKPAHFLLVLPLLLAGCGPSGPERGSVSGKVLLDGQPIEQGSITFIPTDDVSGATAGGVISDGKFDIPEARGPLVGKSRVELRAWRFTGRQIPNPMSPGAMMDEKVEAFPEFYNARTTLVREIESGHNSLDFDLKSEPPAP